MRTGRSTFTFNPRSWHARVYRYWQRNSVGQIKNHSSYTENFCHYCRVVLFWGPLAFICQAPENKDFKWWVPFLFPVPFLLLAWAVYASPAATTTVLLILGFIALVGAEIFLLIDNSERFEGLARRYLLPIWDAVANFFRALKQLIKSIARSTVPFWRWWAETEIFGMWWTRAWMAPVLALAVLLIWLFPGGALTLLKIVVVSAVVVAIAVAVKVYLDRNEEVKETIVEKAEHTGERFKLGYAFVASKKHRICPLIEIEGTE